MKLHTKTVHRSAGFTLIEIMAVVLIIGLLIAAVGGPIARAIFQGTNVRVRNDIQQLESTIEQYNMEFRKYPESLDVLLEGEPPYMKRLPKDPWGNEYYYNPPQTGNEYEIGTYGRDGVRGGEGDDADISNLTLDERDE